MLQRWMVEETVLGTAMLLIGENSRTVAQRVSAKLQEIARSLPDGVVARAVYDRTASGRSDHRDRREESSRRRAARHRHPVSVSRQHPRGDGNRLHHSPFDADHHHRHGGIQGQRQPHESGCHRLRHHHRRRRHHRRKLPGLAGRRAASARAPADRARSGSRPSLPAPARSCARASSAW